KSEETRSVTAGFAITGSHRNNQALNLTEGLITITRNSPWTMNGSATVAGAAPVSAWPGIVGHADVALAVTYTNKLTNPQGGGTVNFDVDGVMYQAKTNSLINFSVDPSSGITNFSSKVNV